MIRLQRYLTLLIFFLPPCCYFLVLFVVLPFLYLFFMWWCYSALCIQLYSLFVLCICARNFLYFNDFHYYLCIYWWLPSIGSITCITNNLEYLRSFSNSACSKVNLWNLVNFSSWHQNPLSLKPEIWVLLMTLLCFIFPHYINYIQSFIKTYWVCITYISSVPTHQSKTSASLK